MKRAFLLFTFLLIAALTIEVGTAKTSSLTDEQNTINEHSINLSSEPLVPNWFNVTDQIAPEPRHSHSMAHDTVNNVTILFGGYSESGTVYDDTWAFHHDSQTWEELSTNTPGAIYGSSMVYIEATNKIMLVGGIDETATYLNQAWTFDYPDKIWTLLSNVLPEALFMPAIAFSPFNNLTYVQGGLTVADTISRSTYSYNYTTDSWTDIGKNLSPGLYGHSMIAVPVPDSVDYRLVITGGLSSSFKEGGYTMDLPSGNWNSMGPAFSGARAFHQFVYDTKHEKAILFGGSNETHFLDDIWEYQEGIANGVWAKVETNITPPPRSHFSMIYNPTKQTFLVFGGTSDYLGPTDLLRDTWVFQAYEPIGGPTITPAPDVSFEEGQASILTWQVADFDFVTSVTEYHDYNPSSFIVYLNDTIFDNGTWTTPSIDTYGEIEVDFLGVKTGVYEVRLWVNDTTGFEAEDTVIMHIIDTTAPVITHALDPLTFEEGTLGNQISWNITDLNPGVYSITFENGTEYTNGPWESGDPVLQDVSSLPVGSYNFTMNAEDLFSNFASDSVIVNVHSPPTTTPSTTNTVSTTSTISDTQDSSSSSSSTTDFLLPFWIFPVLGLMIYKQRKKPFV
ncbi:MAG: Kelch repeat-containing protein [Candidatus Kariarchaeaceae archaeon]|jgi:hypothetical protein